MYDSQIFEDPSLFHTECRHFLGSLEVEPHDDKENEKDGKKKKIDG